MKPQILNNSRLPAALLQRLAADYTVTALLEEPDAAAHLAAHGARYAGVVTSAAHGLSAAQLAQLPNLQVISSFGVGLDKLPLEAARARGIPVGYTPDVLNDCVADTAFGLLLDVARRISEADRWVRSGAWPKGPFPLSRKVSGARLGLVGLGRIGRTIAQRSTGFDMAVRYHSRNVVADAPWAHEPSLIELAKWADFLVVITAGGPSTRHLVNTAVLDALGPEGFIVNVARGSVIDEVALLKALQDKRIAGAGLDVFEDEPHVPEAFFALDNVVLLPHVASATHQTRQAMADRVYDNLHGYFTNGKLVTAA